MHFATAGAAVMIADSVKNEYRDSTTRDLYDLARIADNCEHIHMFQRMCVLRDLEDTYEMDLNTTYCCVAGTRKHVGASWSNCNHLSKALEMLHIIAGGEAQWRARPFVSQSNCFVVPPMKFAQDALECLRVAVEGGMPVLLLSAGQAGATTPATLAGAVSQAWAECIGGLVYVNAIEPGGSSDYRRVAFCLRFTYRRHERRLPRARLDLEWLRPARALFRPAIWYRLRYD